MRRGKVVQGTCSNPACGASFWRRPYDLARAVRPFCSRRCAVEAAPGPAMARLTCAGCGSMFERAASKAKRWSAHYCSRQCERSTRDHAALAREGWKKTPVRRLPPPLVRYERSSRAGQARARALSAERLRQISQLGVAARMASGAAPAPRRAGRSSKSFSGSWLAVLEPVLV